MIDKEKVQQNGLKMIDNSDTLTVQKNEKLAQLKKLIPNVVNSDNQVDTKALQDFIDIAQTTSNNKGYELTFAGKGIARAKADSETTKELQVEKAQSKNFDTTQNVVIRGDNLEVLKILKQNYFGKIKMIYIDPPYNTKSENFIYDDNFKESESDLLKTYGLDEEEDKETLNFLQNVYSTKSHSGWLSFMYPRLKLARDLLKEDGVIFISIDDNEVANLRIMCDEIFGEENFVGNVVRKTKLTSNKGTHFSPSHEYIFVYSKNISSLPEFNDREAQEEDNYIKLFKYTDERGKYNLVSLYMPSLDKRPNQRYYIKCPDGSEVIGKQGKMFRWTQETLLKNIKDERVVFKKTETSPLIDKNGRQAKWNIYTKLYLHERQAKGIKPITFFNKYPNSLGSKYLINLKIPFSFSKPHQLIQYLAKLSTNSSDLILDFFAGSGTTGDAVMQLNAEDISASLNNPISAGSMQVEEQRKFILVQWDEEIKEKTEAYKFCTENNFKPVISSITIERLNRAGEKIKKEQQEKNGMFDNQGLDIGYKVFSLTEKPKLAEDKDGLFVLENERTETIDTLVNMLCATCHPLDTQITEIEKDKLYSIEEKTDNGINKFLFVLGMVETRHALSLQNDDQIYIDGWADIHLKDWLNLEIGKKKI